MDPIQYLASQSLQRHRADAPDPGEMDAFYDRHGLGLFAALPRWRARLKSAWRGLHTRPNRPSGFAPDAQRG